MRYDAIVVGARCAGAATAMLLARAGARVLVLERGEHGADTLSTHALMRAGVLQLHRWGLVDRLVAAGTPPVRRATFHYADEALAIPLKVRDGIDALFAPRRTVLDPLLVEAAWDAGAEIRHGARVVGLLRSGERVTGVTVERSSGALERIEAGLVVGADGLRSSVAAYAGARTLAEGRHATATIYGHFAGAAPDGYHWHFRPGISAGALPTNEGSCVFVAMPPARFHAEVRGDLPGAFARLLAEAAPSVAALVDGREPLAPLRGFAGLRGWIRRSHGPGWALVGDAGYFRDPLTAHGMTDALRDAELLARAVIDGSGLERYQATRDDLSRRFFEGTDEVASFAWDLPRVQELHVGLNREMVRETQVLLALDAPAALAAGT